MSILIENAVVVTLDPFKQVIHNGQILIENDRIKDFGKKDEMEAKYRTLYHEKTIDAGDNVVMPGLINIHAHSVTSALRGMEDALLFRNYNRDVYDSLYETLTFEEGYHFSKLAMFEMIRTGTTTVLDCSENMESVANAVKDTGIRGFISAGRIYDSGLGNIVDTNLNTGKKALKHSIEFIEKWNKTEDERIKCVFHPYSADTCSVDLLKEVATAAASLGVGVTAHLGARKNEEELVKTKYGKTSTEHFADAHILNRSFIGANGAFLNEDELRILSSFRCTVAACPCYIAKLGYTAPICAMIANGVNVGLGTDGLSFDMVKVLRHALTSWRVREHSPDRPQPDQVVDMATINNSKAIGMRNDIGSIEKGKLADLIVLNSWGPDMRPVYKNKFTSNLTHTGMGGDVMTVIVNGKIIMEEKKMKYMDEKEILFDAHAAAKSVWERI